MDALDRVLRDDLNRLVDRLAAATAPGTLLFASAGRPDLRDRADVLEQDIASCRAALLLHYARWRESLEELSDLWALAAAQHRDQPEVGTTASADLRAA